MCVCVCEFLEDGGVCVFVFCARVDETLMRNDEKEGERREKDEGRGANTGGMCFPSGPSGAAFHWRYPEGDLHLIC